MVLASSKQEALAILLNKSNTVKVLGRNLDYCIETHIHGDLFRGPMIPPLAKKIDSLFGDNQGVMNAALIGQASRDSELNPRKWNDIGSELEVFQYIKQLWHTIGYFG